ncbi:MAG TPA: hypothetical protein VFN30_14855 [Chitinophagaceae bacterium]|nr:hypothetical protein [Chitinophagaceae bacterium]
METTSPYKSNNGEAANSTIVLRLVYFWAFIEAGLGGLLHLLHIPLTGFIVGGFAVIIIVLLAEFGKKKAAVFIKTLGIVLAVKFILSPHTPLGAYIAVSFQGLLAVCIFSVFGLNRGTIFLFATIVMIESGIQKPLMAYIVFGKEFWDSAAVLLSGVFRISTQKIKEAALIFLTGYLLLYFIWGGILAIWSNYLRKKIRNLQPDENWVAMMSQQLQLLQQTNKPGKKNYWLIITGIFVLGLILVIPLLAGKLTGFYLLRTTLFFSILLFIAPLLIRKHQFFLFQKNKTIVNDIAGRIPEIKNRTLVAWKLAEHHQGLKKMKYFITYAIWLNVFYEQR